MMMSPWNGVILSFLAGAATSVGGVLVFAFKDCRPLTFSFFLSCAGGVMTYVSFTEILPTSREFFVKYFDNYSAAAQRLLGTFLPALTFFVGWLLADFLDRKTHQMLQKVSIPLRSEQFRAVPAAGTTSATGPVPSGSTIATVAAGTPLSLSSAVGSSVLGSNAVGVANRHSAPSARDCVGSPEVGDNTIWLDKVIEHQIANKPDLSDPRTTAQLTMAQETFEHDHSRMLEIGFFTTVALAMHNFPEGVATYASATASNRLGLGVALAIALHNIPEGIAVAIPMYFGTRNKMRSFLLAAISGAAEPVGALIAMTILGPKPNAALMASLFGLTAGIMTNVSLKDLFFASARYDPLDRVSSKAFFLGMVVMASSLVFIGSIGAE